MARNEPAMATMYHHISGVVDRVQRCAVAANLQCKRTMAVLSPTQRSYLRMAELATVQPHPSARWLQHTHGSHP